MPERLFLVCLTIAAAAGSVSAGTADRPNVIILITDDQGYGDLSCHGNPVLKTPNLDKLHKESVRLTNFHVTPMCTPTRGQVMSGQYALRNGAMNVSSGRSMLRRGLPTIASLMSSLGYRTGMFGKWHLGDNYPCRPGDRGFHESIFFPSSHIGSAPDFWNNCYFDDTYNHNGKREKYKGYCTDVFFGEAMRFMKSCAAKKEPFFTYLATNAPHGPLFVPEKYRDLYKDQKPPVARFFGMIANIDDNVGKLETFLADNNLRENTILIYLTDNGGTVGVSVYNAGMRGRKIELYEGGHRVPCFVRWPASKLKASTDVAELCHAPDILPTVIDMCGGTLPKEHKFDGVSLAPLLRDQADALPDRTLFIQFSRMEAPRPQKGDACVLWQRWRLVQDKELFDLRTDPGQKRNVFAEHPDVVKKMRGDYERFWGEVGPKVNEHEAIIVGADAENPLQLSAADWEDSFLDQAMQVRNGLRRNGTWNIEVAKEGKYEISLRRWPAEADTPIRAGLLPFKHADGVFSAGVALPVVTARLKVGDFEASSPIAADAKAITFTTTLRPGRTQLRATLLDEAGKEVAGAYYVTVYRLPAVSEDFKLEPGFTLLFNGKNLDGWKEVGGKGAPLDGKTEAYMGRFKAIDGSLVYDPKVKGDKYIETARTFGKDVVIRFDFKPGPKCNNDIFLRGTKFDIIPGNKENKQVKEGQWHAFEIAVNGTEILHKIDGATARTSRAGKLATPLKLRAEFGAVEIKNIRVKTSDE
jgi:arylsulfatase